MAYIKLSEIKSTRKKRAVFSPAPARAFISYNKEDINLATIIKRDLTFFGLSVFLAKQDLTPGGNFDTEILQNLESSDIFLPILTKNYYKSEYTDQETGVAVVLNKLILPLRWTEKPRGFISGIHAKQIDVEKVSNSGSDFYHCRSTCKEIIDALITNENSNYDDQIRHSVIMGFTQSPSFAITDLTLDLIKSYKFFTESEVIEILTKSADNNDVYWHSHARVFLKALLRKHLKQIPAPIIKYITESITCKLYETPVHKDPLPEVL